MYDETRMEAVIVLTDCYDNDIVNVFIADITSHIPCEFYLNARQSENSTNEV